MTTQTVKLAASELWSRGVSRRAARFIAQYRECGWVQGPVHHLAQDLVQYPGFSNLYRECGWDQCLEFQMVRVQDLCPGFSDLCRVCEWDRGPVRRLGQLQGSLLGQVRCREAPLPEASMSVWAWAAPVQGHSRLWRLPAQGQQSLLQ